MESKKKSGKVGRSQLFFPIPQGSRITRKLPQPKRFLGAIGEFSVVEQTYDNRSSVQAK